MLQRRVVFGLNPTSCIVFFITFHGKVKFPRDDGEVSSGETHEFPRLISHTEKKIN